jgi:hypothetical protein
MEWLSELLDPQALVLLLILLLAARAFSRMLSSRNPVEAWHFYSSSARDGKQYGDPKKLAVMVFIFSSTFFVGYVLWAAKEITFWVAAMFFGWAIAMLGVDVFSAWARSFVDRRFGRAGDAPLMAPEQPAGTTVTTSGPQGTTTKTTPAK